MEVDYRELPEGTAAPMTNRRVKICPACGKGCVLTVNKDGSFRAVHTATVNQFEFEGKTYNVRQKYTPNSCVGSWGSAVPAKKEHREALAARRADERTDAAAQYNAWHALIDRWLALPTHRPQ
jgi:hypothetical protein